MKKKVEKIKVEKSQLELCVAKLTDVVRTRKYVSGYRPDGMKVFLDVIAPDDEDAELLAMLNNVRVSGTKEDVIMLLMLVRATQIGRNCARTYAPEVSGKIMKTIAVLMKKANSQRVIGRPGK